MWSGSCRASSSSFRPSPEVSLSRPRSKLSVAAPIGTRVPRGCSGDFGFFAPAQALAPALHGRDELREIDLEGVEDVVGVVLGAQADLALTTARLLDDLLRLALGLADDLLLGDQADLLLARLTDDPLSLALGLGQHLL